jgi:hypothetical protein
LQGDPVKNMSKTLRYASAVWILGGLAFGGWAAGCSSTPTNGNPAGTGTKDAAAETDSASSAKVDGATTADACTPSEAGGDGGDAGAYTYTLIDNMETTTHGPIQLAGINPPYTPAYWFNFGATDEDGGDMATPPITMFTFTALPSPTTTLNCTESLHAAHQECLLYGQYDVCGIGLEFVQLPVTDVEDGGAGEDGGTTGNADAASSDGAIHDAGEASSDGAIHDAGGASSDGAIHDAGGDGGDPSSADAGGADGNAGTADANEDGGDAASIPRVTVPFDISQYKGITFWGKAAADSAGLDAGGLSIKVEFPDTDTDPRGGVCDSAAAGVPYVGYTGSCYNSYAQTVTFTDEWQEFTILFSQLAIDPLFGYQHPAPWSGTNVYGIEWQGQDNNAPNMGSVTVDFWVDTVYFIQ